jgi:hypothetical protein
MADHRHHLGAQLDSFAQLYGIVPDFAGMTVSIPVSGFDSSR